jgi:hypothetical protein
MKRLLAIALPFAVAACGDNIKGDSPDATSIDAAVDAAIDAPPDAPPAPGVTGTISLQEVKLLNPGNSGTYFGQGPQASITFVDGAAVPAPLLEEMVGSPLGCKAWSYTPAQTVAAVLGVDEGPVTFTATAGTVQPTLPACVFQAGAGYICPQVGTAQVGGSIGIVAAGSVASFTDADVTFTDANSIGSYITISGAANATNNGTFPIVSRVGANTVAYANPVAMAEALPAGATHVNLGAVGPIPNMADPGFMSDDVALTINHAAGAHIGAFAATTGAGTIGDQVGIVHNELIKLNDIPLDGTAFTISCDGANCGAASGSILILRTTDAPLANLSPFALPPPVTKRVEIRCAAIGQTSVTVPMAYSQLLMSSGATRIQATFIRPTLMGGGPATVNVIAGHAVVGFTNRPPA